MRPGAQRVAFTIDETDRTALRVGLTFASHLRRLFPDFYVKHIDGLKTTMEHLLATMGAFLTLVHTELLALDIEAIQITPGGFGGWYAARIPFTPKNPVNALASWHGKDTSRLLLANEGKVWLAHPVPKVYGVGIDAVSRGDRHDPRGRSIGKHALTVAIWQLLRDTPWVAVPADAVTRLATDRFVDVELGRTVAVMPSVSADTPMAPLCAWLDREKPGGIRQLGAMIAFACQRTGIGFADTAPEEVRQHYEQVVDLDWERARTDFTEARQEQQAAAALANSYSRLLGRIQREPDALVAIRKAILDGAQAVVGDDRSFGVYNPHALIWKVAA